MPCTRALGVACARKSCKGLVFGATSERPPSKFGCGAGATSVAPSKFGCGGEHRAYSSTHVCTVICVKTLRAGSSVHFTVILRNFCAPRKLDKTDYARRTAARAAHPLSLTAALRRGGRSMNDHNANELCGVLSGAYCFAELDVRITEALELADCCNHIGIDLAQLAAPLDAAARAAEAEEETAQPHLKRQRSASDVGDVLPGERRAVLDVSAFDPHTASAVLTCAGRYCALVNQPGLALGHFRAALAASSTGGHSPSTFGLTGVPEPEGSSEAEAHLGMVQSALQLGLRDYATSLTMSFWRGGSAGGVAPPM